MDFPKVDVELRSATGKGSSRRQRAGGRVPAVLYGRKEAPLPLSLDPLGLLRSVDKERKRNTVFSLAVSGNGQAQEVTALIRDVQINPVTQKIVHIDFLRVSLEEEVRVTVPLVLKGTPVGVVHGGNLHQSLHAVPVAARPTAIPVKIEIDVSGLNMGQALHVSDLQLETGVRLLLDPKQALASVVAPRQEKAEAGAGAATAEAGAPAAAAASAEGAAAAPAGAKKEGKEAEKKGK
jgi:large subunit ribosomal protein L25